MAMVEPSRAPPPKNATLSACVRNRVWILRKAPSKKYSCPQQDTFHPRASSVPFSHFWSSPPLGHIWHIIMRYATLIQLGHFKKIRMK